MRQLLNDDFWGLYKDMNCNFPLKNTEAATGGEKQPLEVFSRKSYS